MAQSTLDRFFSTDIAEIDPAVASAIANELERQRDEIELIASENIVSHAVLQAQGSVLTNKYAEGYPGRRYYGGCQFVDVAEEVAIARAKQLFGCGFANVQPNSGSQANQGVFLALMKPGDTFMGLDLAAGGHLTHGAKPNMSGKWFNVVSYGVRPDDLRIDMEALARLAPEKPTITSGIRLGTAAATSRGFGQKEFETVGRLIAEVLDAVAVSNDGTAPMVEAAVKQKVAGLTAAFPIYRTRSG